MRKKFVLIFSTTKYIAILLIVKLEGRLNYWVL